ACLRTSRSLWGEATMYNARLPLISIFTILGVVGLIIAAYLTIVEQSPFAYFSGMGALVFVGIGRLIYLIHAIERNTCRERFLEHPRLPAGSAESGNNHGD